MPAKRVQHQSSPVQRDTGYAQAVINGLAAPENRSVVTAVGLFIVGCFRDPGVARLEEKGAREDGVADTLGLGRRRVPAEQLERVLAARLRLAAVRRYGAERWAWLGHGGLWDADADADVITSWGWEWRMSVRPQGCT